MFNISFRKFKLSIMYDNCKRCGCTYFECNRCIKGEFYRHEDDQDKMKSNIKIIKERGLKNET